MIRRNAALALVTLLTPCLAMQGQSRSSTPSKAPVAAPVHFILASAGNAARFIVREKLMMNTVDNDAIGVTTAVSGAITLDGHGRVDSATSRFIVQLDSLTTDQSRRDRFFKNNTLQTQQFPTAVLVVKELQGLPAVLPTSGTMNLTIIGDFTVHGVTKPSTWTATVVAEPTGFSGKATTHVKFEDFNMTQPSVPVIARLDDDIKLEYDFHFVRQ
jgi:polyisoprenoid-binding protein YceI